jgi:phosphoribosylamine--glycine ligase
MRVRGTPYTGILYAGLMLTKDGPQLIEYNARLGDPETQVLLPRLRSDLVTALLAACDGLLNSISLQWSDAAALTVVMAANGYPGAVEKGSLIKGIDRAEELNDVIVFHAGTKQDSDRIVASGGRVLNVTALGATITEAQRKTYEAVDRIDWPEGFCRRDIGWRAVEREQR